MADLFAESLREVRLQPGAWLFGGFAASRMAALIAALDVVAAAAPFRHMETPGGRRMSVATTGCGTVAWVSDRSGYRYSPHDPESGQPWPALPEAFRTLARDAAGRAGFPGFEPDTCLVNRYAPGARLSLHRDVDERDFDAPIVSVSLGLPATFLFGGPRRGDVTRRVPLAHGDVVVWGGAVRRHYHGVLPVADGRHAVLGRCRVNLTLRRAR